MTKSITLQLPIEFISDDLISAIESISGRNKGPHKLKLQIFHRDEEVVLGLLSKAYNVKVDGDFIEEISRLGIKYKLN